MLDLIAFDADDTLWHTEHLYSDAQARFQQLLAPYGISEPIEHQLFAVESANLGVFGFGIKSFALSMIETAIQLTGGQISGADVQRVIDLAKDMLSARVELLDYVEETVARLAQDYPLMIITKGDLLDQESKIERSGLGQHFKFVEIVSDKNPASYAALLARHQLRPAGFLMIGNSLRSDVLPVLALGARAVHIPYRLTWAHERVSPEELAGANYAELEHLGQLPELIERMRSEVGRQRSDKS
jgi:putative hydrolase of the HAD superfamily